MVENISGENNKHVVHRITSKQDSQSQARGTGGSGARGLGCQRAC